MRDPAETVAKRNLRYSMQQLYFASGVALVAGGFVAIALVTWEITLWWAWVSPLFVALVALVVLLVSARSVMRTGIVHDPVSLRLRADAVARLYRLTNRHIGAGGAIALAALVAWYVSWLLGIVSGWYHDLFRIPFLVGAAFACLGLAHIHLKWFHYFYCARKVGVEAQVAELYYREALQRHLRQSHQMLVSSEYESYCAVANGTCRKLVEHQGPLSSFMAYPFVEESTRRMTALKRELEARHHVVVMPTHDTFAEAVVCKLCKGILSSRYLVAEAWAPNPNVFFEYGLAEGFGKGSWLLNCGTTDGNWMERYPLLADTACIRSNELTAAQLADRIARDSALDTRPSFYTVKRDRKVQESPGSPRSGPWIGTVFGPDELGLRSGGLDEGYARMGEIVRTHLRARGFETTGDAMVGGSHQLANFLRVVDSTSVVCGLLVADTVNEHDEINSIVALLLGYALARQKMILAFQRTPCSKPMIDLRGLIESVRGPVHLAKVCPAMINKYLVRDVSSRDSFSGTAAKNPPTPN